MQIITSKNRGSKIGLRQLYGAGPETVMQFHEAGVYTFGDLIRSDLNKLRRVTGFSIRSLSKWCLQIWCIKQNKAAQFKHPTWSKGSPIIMDIESDTKMSHIWLIGLYQPDHDNITQLIAHDPQREKSNLKSLIRLFIKSKNPVLYTYSGSDVDRRIIKQRCVRYGLDPSPIANLHHHDLVLILRNSLIVPSNYRLKTIASLFGYKYAHSGLNGYSAARKYESFLKSGKSELITQLVKYNEDDLRSTHHIIETLSGNINPENLNRLQEDIESGYNPLYTILTKLNRLIKRGQVNIFLKDILNVSEERVNYYLNVLLNIKKSKPQVYYKAGSKPFLKLTLQHDKLPSSTETWLTRQISRLDRSTS